MVKKTFAARDLLLHATGKELLQSYITYLVPSNVIGVDLISTNTGANIKVCADAYSLHNWSDLQRKITENMIIEVENVDRNNEPGGPWQAFNAGNKYFCYLYMGNTELIIIKLNRESLNKLDTLASQYPNQYQKNHGYNTIVKRIPFKTVQYNLGPALLERHRLLPNGTWDFHIQ